jgi:hypothetical protein
MVSAGGLRTCEMRSPTVTANWLTVPRPPRSVSGEISEMYIGTRDVFKPEVNVVMISVLPGMVSEPGFFGFVLFSRHSSTLGSHDFVFLPFYGKQNNCNFEYKVAISLPKI